ncbi:hypothetical protein E2320_020870, partial [Naja naja]
VQWSCSRHLTEVFRKNHRLKQLWLFLKDTDEKAPADEMSSPPAFPCFHPTMETWYSYINRFECFLDAADLADISNYRKKSYFLSFCGAAVFDTDTALLAPQSVKEAFWEALQEILNNHYAPKPSKIARQLAFRQWAQAEGETISMYMAALRTAALQCGFKELDDMLLDQLVYGVRDLRLQRRLLAKGDLTLKLAIEEAQATEMSNLSAAEIQGMTSSPATKPNDTVYFEEITPDENLDYGEDVNCLTNRQQLQQQGSWNSVNKPQQYPPAQVICLSCGGNHLRPTCRFRNAISLNCQRKGHLARVCKSAKKTPQFQPLPPTRYQKNRDECFTILSESSSRHLAEVLRKNQRLRTLSLSLNNPDDQPLKELCEGLKYPACTIETLCLSVEILSESSSRHLAERLRTLSLSLNNPDDQPLKELCEGLKYPACTIETL